MKVCRLVYVKAHTCDEEYNLQCRIQKLDNQCMHNDEKCVSEYKVVLNCICA